MTKRNDIERLFKTYYSQMFRLAAALLHDDDSARDIVHEVFASLLHGSYDPATKGAYLLKTVRSRCLNHIRNCEIHQRIAKLYFIENEEYDSEDWPDEEMLEKIYSVIQKELSPQARKVIELRFSREEKFKRISEIMGISETAVYRHLSQALKIIRIKLKENG